MGKIICDVHGLQLISFTSPKVRQNIRQFESKYPVIKYKTLALEVFGVQGSYFVDEEFFDENRIDDDLMLSEDDAEEVFQKLVPVCGECLKDFRRRLDPPS
jgi:hypothetical protein